MFQNGSRVYENCGNCIPDKVGWEKEIIGLEKKRERRDFCSFFTLFFSWEIGI